MPKKPLHIVCTFPGCDRPHVGKGYCGTHYYQFKKGKELKPIKLRGAPVCSFEGCGRPSKSLGYCAGHYQQASEGRPLKPLVTRQKNAPETCTISGCDNKHKANGLCQSHYSMNRNLRSEYGIDLSYYEQMKAVQGGKCAVCGGDETQLSRTGDKVKNLAVDHCHDTGAVRGLLCTSCNTAIGHFDDNPALLRAAAAYIERHRDDKTA